MSADDVLFDQVGAELTKRPGWRYEPSTTPGGPPSWCLDPGGTIALSVNVIDGTVTVYVPENDRDVVVGGVDDLLTWLDNFGDRYLTE